ncbi:DUF6531 domain-containing protein [Butyrivibrio sp. MC2021]|uniref:DUF6531 domain-containing protein n=1 Tax=Butyrivibrio sp. MC2021 TaxID=1408306 RepID=UPI00047A380B|nr:DUF6531 domain-containing protein [Butyrivibrio sp. MC2021]
MSGFSINPDSMKSRVNDFIEAAGSLNVLAKEVSECSDDISSFSSSFSMISESLMVLAERVDKHSEKSTQFAAALSAIISCYTTAEENILSNIGLPQKIAESIKKTHEQIDALTDDGATFGGGGKGKNRAYEADPVDMTSGNFVDDIADLRFYGATKLTFARHYNSLYLNVGTMGLGWSHSYDANLLIGQDEITVVWGNQTRVRYEKTEDGRYVSAADSKDFIQLTEGEYHLHTRSKKDCYFNLVGQLVRYRLANKNTEIQLTYNENGRLSQAADKFGNTLSYEYNENGLLSLIKDSVGREISFVYDAIFLTAVVTADGLKTGYEYDDSGRLKKVIAPDGSVKLDNTYDDENRVVNQVLPDGAVFKFEYGTGYSKIINPDNSETTYEYDDRGRITAIRYPVGCEFFEYNNNDQRTTVTDRNGNVTRMEYDDQGNAISAINALGVEKHYSYDDAGNRIEAVLPCRGTVRTEYDEEGNIIGITDALGFTKNYDYQEGFLCNVTNPDKTQVSFSYDDQGRLSKVVNESGNCKSFKYDSVGRKIEETDGCGNITKYTYDAADRFLTIENPKGQLRRFFYDNGKLIKVTDFDGYSEEYTYDVAGHVATHTDKAGNKTSYEYDHRSNLVKVVLPNGKQIEKRYDAMNRMVEEIGPENKHSLFIYDALGNPICKNDNGRKTTFEFDALNRIVKEEGPDGKIEYTYDEADSLIKKVVNDKLVTLYAYNETGRMVMMEEPDGSSCKFNYDSRRRLTDTTDALGGVIRYDYYPDGKLRRVDRPDGTFEEKEYDPEGRVISKTNQAGYRIHTEYDELGRVVRLYDDENRSRTWQYLEGGQVFETNTLGRVTSFRYSPTGKVSFMKDPSGQEARYKYNEMDELTAILRNNVSDEEADKIFANLDELLNSENETIRCTKWEKDSFGRITARIDAKGNRHEWNYGAAGELLSETDENNNEISRSYDENFNLLGVSYPEGLKVTYKYDEHNRLSEVEDWTGKLSFGYDPAGKLLFSVGAEDQKVSYRYDEVGRQVGIVYPDGKVARYTYNDGNRIARLEADSLVADYTYDKDGHVASRNVKLTGDLTGKELFESYTYNPEGHIVSLKQKEGDKALAEYKYDYDNIGNVIFKSVIFYKGTEKAEEKYRYEYDALGHLSKVFLSEGGDEKLWEEYRYDEYGNCVYSNVGGKERINKYDILDRLVNSHSPEMDYNVDYSYDKKGSLIQTKGSDNTTREYNFDGTLKKICNEEGVTEYNVNSFGGVINKKDDKGVFRDYWIDYSKKTMPSIGYNDGNGWRSLYRDFKLLGTSFAGTAGLFMSDEKGSVQRFLDGNEDWSDATGDILYSHYGEVLSGKDNLDRTFGLGYTGLETAAFGDTWRTTTREFAPSIGRFLSRDKDEFIRLENPSGLNQYQYCFGNPVVWIDPEGTDCYIFYIPDREDRAKYQQKELAEQYGIDISEVHLVPVDSPEDFENGWNNMGVENGQNVDIDAVIINAHASPLQIGNGGGWHFDTNDISKLDEKDVGSLFLTGCNAGHNDYQQENVAAEFARKVNGAPVLASDGTGWHTNSTYESRGDEAFDSWCRYGERDNDGWLVYYEEDGEVHVIKLGEKELGFDEVLKTLKKYEKKYRCMMSGGGPSAGGEVDWDTQPA